MVKQSHCGNREIPKDSQESFRTGVIPLRPARRILSTTFANNASSGAATASPSTKRKAAAIASIVDTIPSAGALRRRAAGESCFGKLSVGTPRNESIFRHIRRACDQDASNTMTVVGITVGTSCWVCPAGNTKTAPDGSNRASPNGPPCSMIVLFGSASAASLPVLDERCRSR
jgi:hypothetical protein